jgi:hemolysin D
LIWSIVGRIEIVAVAPGKIIPSGQVKVIQAGNIGRVKAIHVSDGDTVRAGQALIELDPTLAEADRQRLESEWVASSLELARWRAYSGWLDNGKPGTVSAAAVDMSAIFFTALAARSIHRAATLQDRWHRPDVDPSTSRSRVHAPGAREAQADAAAGHATR